MHGMMEARRKEILNLRASLKGKTDLLNDLQSILD